MPEQKTPEEIIRETIKHGGYLANAYFDLHATTADDVKHIMVGFISKLTKEKGVVYAVGEIDEPLEKDGTYSTWAEVKVLAEDFRALARIAGNYSPIGFEILKPDEVRLSLGQAQSLLLDVAQTSHNFTQMIMQKMLSKEELEEFKRKMNSRAELGKRLLEKKG